MARLAARFFGNFHWALTLAGRGNHGRRVVLWVRLGLDHRGGRLDVRGRRRWLGERCSLSGAVAIASALISAALFAVVASSIELVGKPDSPVLCAKLASCAAITSLGPSGQKPAFTTFEQAPAATGMPAAGAGWLTGQQRVGKLETAHGRYCSRAVRRREGGTSRRYLAPKKWTPLVQLTCGNSLVREGAGVCREEGQYRDRRIAEWLNGLCNNGSVRGRF